MFHDRARLRGLLKSEPSDLIARDALCRQADSAKSKVLGLADLYNMATLVGCMAVS